MIIFDLSIPIEANCSEPVPIEIERISHEEGADLLGQPAGLDRRDFPQGLGLSLELIKAATHAGTHVDAPAHYGPLCEGQPARTVDQLPLEWFYQDGVVIDCRSGALEEAITADELAVQLDSIGYHLKPLDIVLIHTGTDRLWGQPEYFTHFRGMSREATAWLVEQQIKVIGIDTFGFDQPFPRMLASYRASGRQDELWPAHMYGREREYCQIERLANLDRLPAPFGFKVACFPINVRGCGAGWSRVVAVM
jgi:kynurenine formamidase